jgi:hypothetical protein
MQQHRHVDLVVGRHQSRKGLALREGELAAHAPTLCERPPRPIAPSRREHAARARRPLLHRKQRSRALTWILTVCGDRSSSRAISLLE